jgi:hypothetical protein
VKTILMMTKRNNCNISRLPLELVVILVDLVFKDSIYEMFDQKYTREEVDNFVGMYDNIIHEEPNENTLTIIGSSMYKPLFPGSEEIISKIEFDDILKKKTLLLNKALLSDPLLISVVAHEDIQQLPEFQMMAMVITFSGNSVIFLEDQEDYDAMLSLPIRKNWFTPAVIKRMY